MMMMMMMMMMMESLIFLVVNAVSLKNLIAIHYNDKKNIFLLCASAQPPFYEWMSFVAQKNVCKMEEK
jgi:hypothetical protein